MRQPGIEPGSSAWEADMITITLLALVFVSGQLNQHMLVTAQQNEQRAPPTGLEPVISPLGGERLIH